MNITEINKPVTAKALNESLARRFGKKFNIDAFTTEQLQDARNKLRTALSQVETNESFNSVKNETYQKNKLFLDVLNAAIAEREEIVEAKCDDCGKDPCCCDEETNEAAKPDYIDIDKDGDKKEPMKKAAKDAKKKKVDEETRDEKKARFKQKRADKRIGDKISKDAEITSPAMQKKKSAKNDLLKMAGIKKESIDEAIESLNEGKEDEAELVMAAKDMVDRVTGWMEDTAEMQTESMLELADAIRDELGAEQSESFVNTVKPALESLYATMETTREALTSGVGQLTGEGGMPADTMGMDDELGGEMEPTVDDDLGPEPVDDAAEGVAIGDVDAAAAGGADEAGRARRESRMYKKKAMIESSRRLGAILSKKK